jgi:hypothetical protein
MTRSLISAKGAADVQSAQDARAAAIETSKKRYKDMKAAGPYIDAAVGTGQLATRGHGSPVHAGEHIYIDADTAYGGLVCVGPMGSGKSRAVAQPWVGHWLEWKPAGLFAYGVKPNWSKILVRIARAMGRSAEQIHVVGPAAKPWPLLIGLEPDNVANFCSEAFRRNGGSGGDQFFADSAINMVSRTAGILYSATAGGRGRKLVADTVTANGEIIISRTLGYNLSSISEIVHARDDDWKAIKGAVLGRVAELAGTDREASEDLEHALHGYERLTKDLADKTRGSVVGQIDSVIEPFDSRRELRRAFCGDEDFDLESALANGGVVILDIDLGAYAAAARLVYLLAFEQARRLMLRRIADIEAGKRVDPVAFVADEYAEVAAPTHKSMWRLCREARIAPAIFYQLHSDLRSVVGSADAADALVGGMKTKILFSTDDKASVDLVSGALGQVRNTYSTHSRNEGRSSGNSSGSNHGPQGGGNSGWNSGTSSGESWSESLQNDTIVDAQVIQSLPNRIRRDVPLDQQVAHAVLIGELRGKRVADVVEVKAWDPPAVPYVGKTCGEAWG